MTIAEKAEAVVAEMIRLGARFEIEPTSTAPVFVWFARPPSQRDAVAAYWDGVDKSPGLREAMTQAILRQQAGGAL